MEKVTVDAEGKVTIPPEVLRKCRVGPGDELTLVESAEGLLIYQGGVDANTQAWWDNLSPEDQERATAQATADAHLSEAQQDAQWNEGAELPDDPEGDEIELPVP